MQSVLDRLGGFSQQSSVYSVLGRVSSAILPGKPLAFTPFLLSGQDISGESVTVGITSAPCELPESVAEAERSDLSWKH